jgi:RNA polymerase sigma factor (sigma-70 family)
MNDDNWGPSYPKTQWTQIIAIMQQGRDEKAETALAQFCESYRPAIRNFFRSHARCTQEDAEDYTHSFFESKVFKHWEARDGFLDEADRTKVERFRSFLTSVLWRFWRDEQRKAMAAKRGRGLKPEPPGEEPVDETYKKFGAGVDREIALFVIKQAADLSKHSPYLIARLRGEITPKEAAQKLGYSEGSLKRAYSEFLDKLADALWEEAARLTGPSEEDIRDEIRHLISVFADPNA